MTSLISLFLSDYTSIKEKYFLTVDLENTEMFEVTYLELMFGKVHIYIYNLRKYIGFNMKA